jgi:adenylate cyclase
VTPTQPESETERVWRETLVDGYHTLNRLRHIMRWLPSNPRCKVCANPFAGPGGKVVGLFGFTPSRKNPNLCAACCDKLPPGGLEIDIAVLFADVRGSTSSGEHMRPAEFAGQMNRFYKAATDVLLRHDALIDKLIGDEVMALFLPGIAGKQFCRRAAEAGVDLLREAGYRPGGTPWLSLGVAVHFGPAYVGNVGPEGVVDFTALGDTVNTTARLQGEAAAGELILSSDLLAQCDRSPQMASERRTLSLVGGKNRSR